MKEMRILRGIPDSGKSVLVRRYAEQVAKQVYPYTDTKSGDPNGKGNEDYMVVCCARDYFTRRNGGEFKFDPRHERKALAYCFRKAMAACVAGTEVVIIDGVNLMAIDIAPYVMLAQSFDYAPMIVTVDCHPIEAFKVHDVSDGVPLEDLYEMRDTLVQQEGRFLSYWQEFHTRAWVHAACNECGKPMPGYAGRLSPMCDACVKLIGTQLVAL